MRDMPLTFGDFTLDPANRTLLRGGQPVEISARYLDALVLLAREPGELVTKDRFMDEVWRGVPVTDDALTQAIRALRKALGDDAASPRFIETVPKHGYRFVAQTQSGAGEVQRTAVAPSQAASPGFLDMCVCGALGAALAGVVAGVLYSAQARAVGGAAGSGLSIALIIVAASVLAAAVSGFGIAAGVAAARFVQPPSKWWFMAGGALGGMITGALASLVLADGFALLTGYAPAAMTGVLEGVLMGGAVGLTILYSQALSTSGRVAVGLVAGGGTGVLIHSVGGVMLGDSLGELIGSFPDARLRIKPVLPAAANALFEGAVFVACVSAAIGRQLRQD